MGILSLLSGQIAYPDGRRSRHGRITEVELYKHAGGVWGVQTLPLAPVFFFSLALSERSVMYEDTPTPCLGLTQLFSFFEEENKCPESPTLSVFFLFQGWRSNTACIYSTGHK